MIVLTIRTDKPQAEIGLFDGNNKLAYTVWEAHRKLAETIHKQIAKILQSVGKDWQDIEGIVCFKGPGSFTGLRIGLSVGNALAYGLGVPIAGAHGADWIKEGRAKLAGSGNDKFVLPEYGGDVFVTKPRK